MSKVKWTAFKLSQLRELYGTHTNEELGKLLGFTATAVKVKARIIGVKKGERERFTGDQIDFIKSSYSDMDTKIIAKKLNRSVPSVYHIATRFGLKKSEAYMKTEASGRIIPGVRIGIGFEFRKGQAPINKGKKQSEYMSQEAIEKTKATRFQKGLVPHNTKFDGHISIRNNYKRKYAMLYIREGKNVWKQLSRVVWEKLNGPIPKGHNIQFSDNNPLNCKPENLYMINKRSQMKQNSIMRYDPELRSIFRLAGKLKRKIKSYEEQN